MRCRLKELREEKRMTQEQLSIKSGVSRPTIISIENDENYNATIGTLIKLCDALGVGLDQLFSVQNAG